MTTSHSGRAVRITYRGTTALFELSDGKLNAFSASLIEDLRRALEDVAARDEVRCVVLTGQKRAFSVGARLDVLRSMTLAEQLAYNATLIDAFGRVASLPMPTIAAIGGFALGGGLELALACTFRVAATGATLGLPEARLGILPGAGGTQRLPRLIGRTRALRLLLTGESVNAERAHRMGLVDEVADDPVVAALALADQIAASSPLAVSAIRETVAEYADSPVHRAVEQTATRLGDLLATRDAAEGMAAFAEKRTPRWTGS